MRSILLVASVVALLALPVGALSMPVKSYVYYHLKSLVGQTLSCCLEEEVAANEGRFDYLASQAVFNNVDIGYPQQHLINQHLLLPQKDVLGTRNLAGEDKWIEVSLSQQILRAWEGNNIVMEFPISSGVWNSTPKGDYTIWHKTRSQTMKGGSRELGTYYYLPNVPFNMFFYKGYAVHGAYWHNNFGRPMSHGCVNTPITQAGILFEWSGPVVPEGKNYASATRDNPGTRVFIH